LIPSIDIFHNKKHDILMTAASVQTACFKCPPSAFIHSCISNLLRYDSSLFLLQLGFEAKATAHIVLQLRGSVLWCILQASNRCVIFKRSTIRRIWWLLSLSERRQYSCNIVSTSFDVTNNMCLVVHIIIAFFSANSCDF